MTGAAWGEARNAGPARKKYISRVERTEKGEVKESNFFHCRDRRHLRNFSVSLSLPFQHSPLFGCGAASEQIKDERAEPNSFGVTVERDEGEGGEAQKGPFPQPEFQGIENDAKIGVITNANAKSPCILVQSSEKRLVHGLVKSFPALPCLFLPGPAGDLLSRICIPYF